MNETALNILAITIFVITMTVLSIPFSGISPLIPTTITVLGLALYGFDAAYIDGKGGTKIINWIESKLPGHEAKQARILHHEAGHFLAAHVLGIKVIGYNLQPDSGSKIGVEVENSAINSGYSNTVSNTFSNTLERYCTIWMAGIAAEEHLYEQAKGGNDDLLKLRAAIANSVNPELEERWAKIRAQNLIRANFDAFTVLAAKMQQKATVAECCEALDRYGARPELGTKI